DGVNEVLKVPVQREAGDHGVEQVAGKRTNERGGDAPRRAVEPYLAEPRVDRGGEQQPYAFDTPGVTPNRVGVDVGSRGEHVHGDEQVVCSHGREVSSHQVGAFIGDPVPQEGTAFVRAGRVPRIDL